MAGLQRTSTRCSVEAVTTTSTTTLRTRGGAMGRACLLLCG